MAADQVRDLDLAITGLGMTCAAGDEPTALLGAVGAHTRATACWDGVAPEQVGGFARAFAATGGLGFDLGLPAVQLAWIGESALSRALCHLSPGIAPERVLIHIMAPERQTLRDNASPVVDPVVDWAELVTAAMPQVGAVRCRTELVDPVTELMAVADELARGDWEAVVFGGIDAPPGSDGDHGQETGQGAGFVVMEAGPEARRREAPIHARLRGLLTQPRAASCDCTVAWEGLVGADELRRQALRAIVGDRPCGTECRLAGARSDATGPEALALAHVTGEVGVAAMPLQLVLGTALVEASGIMAHMGVASEGGILLCCRGNQQPGGVLLEAP